MDLSFISEKSLVRMIVYDAWIQLLELFLKREFGPGGYQIMWDSTNEFGQGVNGRIYFYELRNGDFS